MKTRAAVQLQRIVTAAIIYTISASSVGASLPMAPDPVPGGFASESRSITPAIERVVISGPVDLSVRTAATPELLIKGDPRLVPRVTTRTEGKTLIISTRGIFVSVNRHESAKVELNLPNFRELHAEGSGDVRLQGLEQERLDLRVTGSGRVLAEGNIQQLKAILGGSANLNLSVPDAKFIEIQHEGHGNAILKGRTRQIQVKLLGSGDVNATSLETRILAVDSSGSGNAHVCAGEEASITISGNGDVTVVGRPAKRHIERKAQGDLIWK